MANERMFLLHEPSGFYVYLAKRMGWGWYGVPDALNEAMLALFDLVERQIAEGNQDQFVIAMDGDERLKVLLAIKDGKPALWLDGKWQKP